MPHILLETTADLTENAVIPDILEALVAKLSSFDTIDPKAVKAYHTLRSVWAMGEGAPPGFAHCAVAVLKGRSAELRKTIADGMHAELQKLFVESLSAREAGLTFELREMDAETYHK